MKKQILLLILLSFKVLLTCVPAMAHIGHLGDLASHTHWVGAGAVAGAAAIGALVAKIGKGKPTQKKSSNKQSKPASEANQEVRAK